MKMFENLGFYVPLIILLLVFGAVVAGLVPLLMAVVSIVVALGLDAFEGDPFHGFAVTTEGFGRIAARIALPGLVLLSGCRQPALSQRAPQTWHAHESRSRDASTSTEWPACGA